MLLKHNKVIVGDLAHYHCAKCHQPQLHTAIVKYRYFDLCHMFGVVSYKRYQICCQQCKHQAIISKDEFENNFYHDKIPISHRWGWLISLSIIMAIWGFVLMRQYLFPAILNSPISYSTTQIANNECYFADLSEISGTGYENRHHAYGILQLKWISSSGNYIFSISTSAYDTKKELEQKIDSIQYDDNISIAQREIDLYKENKVIYAIR